MFYALPTAKFDDCYDCVNECKTNAIHNPACKDRKAKFNIHQMNIEEMVKILVEYTD